VARLTKAQRAALDRLDRPCRSEKVRSQFMPDASIALGEFPPTCFDSVESVAVALAESSRGEIPTGVGGACVLHFMRRSDQLNQGPKVSVERAFALLELTLLASIAGGWARSLQPRVTLASQKECIRHVTQFPGSHVARDQWRNVIAFVLDSPSATPLVLRNMACALIWCGYFSPDADATDEHLAAQCFKADRALFVRFRLDALTLISMLLGYSLLPASRETP
jgi:hypothetical protein